MHRTSHSMHHMPVCNIFTPKDIGALHCGGAAQFCASQLRSTSMRVDRGTKAASSFTSPSSRFSNASISPTSGPYRKWHYQDLPIHVPLADAVADIKANPMNIKRVIRSECTIQMEAVLYDKATSEAICVIVTVCILTWVLPVRASLRGMNSRLPLRFCALPTPFTHFLNAPSAIAACSSPLS